MSSVAWTMVKRLFSDLDEQPAANATLPMDAILRKVLRFIRVACRCQGFHVDDMERSVQLLLVLSMDGQKSKKFRVAVGGSMVEQRRLGSTRIGGKQKSR
jgi:hypothetical protein